MADVAAALERIRVRHNTDYGRHIQCRLCGESMIGGYGALQKHMLGIHGLLLPLFDNIDNIDAFLDDLHEGVAALGGHRCTSLATGQEFATLSEMDAFHLALHTPLAGETESVTRERVRASAAHWSWNVLPDKFAKFRLVGEDIDNADDDEDHQDEEVGDVGVDGRVTVGTKEAGVTSDRIECPYCVAAAVTVGSSDVLLLSSAQFSKHLKDVHHIANFAQLVKSVKRADGSRTNFHMHIALINLIRDATDAGQQPATRAPLGGVSASDIVSSLAAEADNNGAESVYVPTVSHFEELAFVDGALSEKCLIPRRPNDPLIAFFTQNDDGSDSGSEWSDDDNDAAPAAPTMAELYKMMHDKSSSS